MVGLARRLKAEPLIRAEPVSQAYAKLLTDDQFKEAYYYSTADEERVKNRISLGSRYFSEA